MPVFDGTGPIWGGGPGAGWGLGPCGAGMAWGRRFGRGRFLGRYWFTRKEETEALKEEAKALEEDLKAIQERMAELKK